MGHHCCSKQKVKRGLWSPEEDQKLINHITNHGHGCWSSVSKLAGLQRCGKSCRLRWINYLRPDLKRGAFTEQEERTIIDAHRILGNKWAQIAKHLPGRTDNEVKNLWNSCIKKKIIAQGLDPNTHNLLYANQNNNNNNSINKSHKVSQLTTQIFSMTTTASTTQKKDTFIDIKTTLSTNPDVNSSVPANLDENSTIMTFECPNNPNLSFPLENQSQQSAMQFSSCSNYSMETIPNYSCSSLNPMSDHYGILNENPLWDTTSEQHQQSQQQQMGGKVFERGIDILTDFSGADQNMVTYSFDTSDLDFQLGDSTFLTCEMYSNFNSVDRLT